MSRLIASVFGIGYLRPGPGTWGSLAAVIVGFLLARLDSPWFFVAATVIATALAYWSIGDLIAHLQLKEPGHHDPSWVVIDEVAGQWVALLPVVFGSAASGVAPERLWPGWFAAFLLFRLFDVWKPGPVGWADRRPGVDGVLLDDIFAGLLAALGVMLLAGLAHGVLLL